MASRSGRRRRIVALAMLLASCSPDAPTVPPAAPPAPSQTYLEGFFYKDNDPRVRFNTDGLEIFRKQKEDAARGIPYKAVSSIDGIRYEVAHDLAAAAYDRALVYTLPNHPFQWKDVAAFKVRLTRVKADRTRLLYATIERVSEDPQ